MESFFKKVGEHIGDLSQQVESTIGSALGGSDNAAAPAAAQAEPAEQVPQNQHRFESFAPENTGNAKWYVDGASYFWAVSEAIEQARESIYILDWWLSPEIFLRRPPSKNEQYRLDRMLKAAAERGVMVHVIVYREVQAALTLDSSHTRTALEALHPNIKVFRHPDHLPTTYDFKDGIGKSLKNSFAGLTNEVVLYWAHHEKLLVVDRRLSFMGGLDLCFGRWDTSSHPIADVHPGNLQNVVFPGQDYNNARVYDFDEVSNWQANKLDRTKSSRMGWTDVALSMNGGIVHDLVDHFVDRWNFIFAEKYEKKNPGKYARLEFPVQAPSGHHGHRHHGYEDYVDGLTEQFRGFGRFMSHDDDGGRRHGRESRQDHDVKIQLTRSCAEWSAGHKLEKSIQNAYIRTIERAKHFIYIENQFFITATDPKQSPVKNQIGTAIVDRIVKAWHQGEDFKVWVLMPAVPAFAGDLKSDGALGTRAIMEFQYYSIQRGPDSIIAKLKKAGVEDPSEYISFYNLRNFDRINVSQTLRDAESRAGVSYEEARIEHDDYVGSQRYPYNEGYRGRTDHYERYQREAANVDDKTLDTISSTYMDGGVMVTDLRWDGNYDDEINAFVSEQLYIHSKLLIADDQIVICGSANLNDRSQLGNHDSEIAVVIEDPVSVESRMNGRPYRASRFAASLRRYIFRKHIGLLPDQRCDRPDQNWEPVNVSPNHYDWDTRADRMVEDPLSPDFLRLWSSTARKNTKIFSRAFHPVPNDRVRTWQDYDEFFSRHFLIPGVNPEAKQDQKELREGKVEYGHIVKEEFPGGIREVQEWLSGIRGTLVDMPLGFLADVDDIAHGLALNGLTEELYT